MDAAVGAASAHDRKDARSCSFVYLVWCRRRIRCRRLVCSALWRRRIRIFTRCCAVGFLRQELSERTLELTLDRWYRPFRMDYRRLLDLPAPVVRAVICDCELDSSHHLQNGSATKRDTTDRPR